MTRAVLVLGAGDVGSAVAHALRSAGLAVAIVDDAAPAHPRRGMAFADALWDGAAELAGLTARRADRTVDLLAFLAGAGQLAITALPLSEMLSVTAWSALVDARMRKRETPPDRRGLARLAIGLGVGFAPGRNCDIAIETSWEAPGQVLHAGGTLPLRGEPRTINGVGRERTVYAPASGVFHSPLRIGQRVVPGEAVGDIDGLVLHAPLGGALRGLIRSGVTLRRGAKTIEVDPRGDPALCFGLGERPHRIAAGVVAALHAAQHRPSDAAIASGRR